MAIDNAEKRRSAAHVGDILLPGVTPNAAKDAEWRQQVNHGYSGILAMVFTAVGLQGLWTRRRRRG